MPHLSLAFIQFLSQIALHDKHTMQHTQLRRKRHNRFFLETPCKSSIYKIEKKASSTFSIIQVSSPITIKIIQKS